VHLADVAKMVCEGLAAVEGVEVANLGVVVEPQKERNLGVLGVLPDDNSILITIFFLRFVDGRLWW